MGASTKKLIGVSVVTDHDCGNYFIGEIQGGVEREELKKFLEKNGEKGFSDLMMRIGKVISDIAVVTEEVARERRESSGCTDQVGREKGPEDVGH